ncbi:MAG: AI-2E family transporter [Deinococcota bacterium]|nr:AI-2E family transporter [Deinococcota bacterium]
MRPAFIQVWSNPYTRVFVVLFTLAVLLYLILQTSLIWISFLLAYFLADTANPLIIWLQRRRVKRWVGVVIVFLLFIMIAALIVLLLGFMARQIQTFAQDLPALIEPLLVGERSIPTLINRFLPAGSQEVIAEAIAGFPARLEGASQAILAWIGGLVGGLFQLFIIFILTIYLMLSFPHVGASLLQLFPTSYRSEIERTGKDLKAKFNRSVGGYIRAQLLVALAVGLMIWISLSIAGIPLAATWGIVGFIGNLVPFLGSILASIPAIFLAVLLEGWGFGLIVAAIFIIINQIDGNVLSPIIMAKVTSLSPITIILAILTGATLLGFWGALLAVPVVGFGKLLYTDYYLNSDWYQERNELP